jgi:phage-related protein
MTIKSLLVKIGADTTGLEAGLKSAQKSIETHAGTLRRVGTAMTAAGGMITGALGLVVKKTYELGHEISELSQKTGISTEVLSGYRVAAEMAGVPLDGFARSLGILAKNMVSFDAESVASNAALTSLGISSTDATGKVKPLDTILLEIADKFKGIEDGATKAALAKAIFGRAGMDLIPVLNLGSAGLQQIYDKTKAAGMVFSKEGAEGCAKFKDSTILLQTSVQGLGASVALQLMPVLTPLIGTVTKIVQGMTGWIAQHPGLMKVLLPLIAAVGVLMTVFGPILIALPALAAGFTLLTGPIGLVGAAITALIAIGALIITHWTEIQTFIVGVWTAIQTAATTVWTAISTFFTTIWETIKGVFVGGWEVIKTGFTAFGTAVWEIVQAIVQGIVDKFTWLFHKVAEIVTSIKDHTIGVFKSIWSHVVGHSIVPEMVASVIANFVNMKTGIGAVMDDVQAKAKTVFGTVADYAQAMATSGSESSKSFAENLKGSVRSMLKTLEGQAIAYIITKIMGQFPFPLNLALAAIGAAAVHTLFSAIKLGEGAVVTRPTLAMIGERGPEAVIPLDKAGGMVDAGVILRQSNYFYGAINNAGDLDEISRRLAERTIRAISKGRR